MKVLYKLSSLSEGSVTRRSAGLPLIINTILASEARIKQVSYVFVSAFIVHTLILISCFSGSCCLELCVCYVCNLWADFVFIFWFYVYQAV